MVGNGIGNRNNSDGLAADLIRIRRRHIRFARFKCNQIKVSVTRHIIVCQDIPFYAAAAIEKVAVIPSGGIASGGISVLLVHAVQLIGLEAGPGT